MKLWRYGQPIEVLGNRYRLEGVLGSGGMAEVFLARDEQLKRWVAIKLLKTEELDQQMLNRFIKEAGQIAGWQHPHILRVYDHMQTHLIDLGEQKPLLFYMVMEYASGGDLQKRMVAEQPYSSLSSAFTTFRQMCGAVQYAHKHGVIHRDIKPLNILFRQPRTGPEEAVLSDFGLAVQIDASHHTFAHAGTLAYMAPEQLKNQAQPASDIFALGVTLYQLCTGFLPFHREIKDLSYVLAGMEPDPLPPSQLNPDLPPDLDKPILQALQADPTMRYKSAAAFWNTIAAALSETQLASETQLNTPPSIVSPSSKPATPVIGIPTEAMSNSLPTQERAEDDLVRDSDALVRRVVTTPSQISLPKAIDLPPPASPIPPRRQRVVPDPLQSQSGRIPAKKKHVPRFFLLTVIGIGILLLITFLLTVLSPLLAQNATITLIPRSQVEQNTYTFSSDQVHAHQLSATALQQSSTGHVSGTIAATKAHGTLLFVNNTNHDVVIPTTTFTGKSGVPVTFNGPVTVPFTNPTFIEVPAFAVHAGANGNIPQFDIVQNYNGSSDVVVKNTAFSGGKDAQPNDKVQQSDIDQAAKPLVDTQTQQAQKSLQAQVQRNEQVIKDSNRCQPTVNANNPVGTQAKTVTVTVSVTCTEEVYDPSAAQALAKSRLSENIPAGYQLSGQVMVNAVQATTTNNGSQATIQVHAQGLWIYSFSQSQLRHFATLIAGKNQVDARALLMRQAGIAGVQFSAPNTLPSVDHIQMKVQQTK